MEIINTAAERFCGDVHFRETIMPPEFNFRAHKREMSTYFRERGFLVSMMYGDYFSRYSGIESDRYLSSDMYYFYVVPCLNRMEFAKAYSDKSIYRHLFRGVLQPENVVKACSGRFYTSDGEQISKDIAIEKCLAEHDRLIIKPSIDTGEGVGVGSFVPGRKDDVICAFAEHAQDAGFVVQRILKQHSEMMRICADSLNTLRLFTYRRVSGEIVCLLKQNFLRFGSGGSCTDNVSTGGGFCHVMPAGKITDRMFRGRTLETFSFRTEHPDAPKFVPCYDKALEFVKKLHEKLLYFDSIGWDVGISPDGQPMLVEFNVEANLRSAQMIGGPMYGDYLDEVMDRVSCVRKSKKHVSRNDFSYGYSHELRIGE